MVNHGPRFKRPKTMVIVAALAAAIIIGATACSSSTGAAVAGSASATNQVQPSSRAVLGSTTRPVSSSTSGPIVDAVALVRSTPVRVRIPTIGVDSG